MCYAESVNMAYVHSWMNDVYEEQKRIELSETELIGLRTLKSMGNEMAAQRLVNYYLSRPIMT